MQKKTKKTKKQQQQQKKNTELAKTFPNYNENIVNSLYSFLIDKLVFFLIKFENDRKKCADTEVKIDISPGEEQVIYSQLSN